MLKEMVVVGIDIRRMNVWTNSLVRAFALSLALHLALFGILELGAAQGWWSHSILPPWLASPKLQIARLLSKDPKKPQNNPPDSPAQEVPLLFVDVDPALAVPEPPKDAKYYSARNAVAANPDAQLDANKPKIDGKQNKVVRTATIPRSNPVPAQPPVKPPPEPLMAAKTPPTPAPKPEVKPTLKPLPEPKTKPLETIPEATTQTPGGPAPGDLAFAKPQNEPGEGLRPPPLFMSSDQPELPRVRPRTLADARQQKGIVGEKMKEEGGVKRRALETSLDVKATPFGSYDAEIIAAIQQHWYDLLDEHHPMPRTGKVVLDFHLMYNGRITDMKVVENDVGELLALYCQRAILDPSPYKPWPPSFRRLIQGNYREVRFTFYYD